ncbi:GDSL-type esterase/lipase family protein [Streptomyces sp. NPDC088354]|uniref:GDSL-type esterase/lipase family protein n=1 Tax=unclassified Streptomyces TaxID=2593676 RepID=UPI00299FDC91|nr:GDSL-type esterase/lipase family protein [Streptomyces sp. MI02-7b]MDX3076037.1 GDSL-type esterase/lipase family protein [Streptomyces sp. MI02-7b]
MFVGDSMTIGSAGDLTWRYRMWRHLSSLGEPFAIVGPRTALYDATADAAVSHAYGDPAFPREARRHLAGWGEGWLHMAPLIEDAVREHRADVLLVSLGLIDLGFYTDPAQTEDNLRLFVERARAANPRVAAVLLPVIPNTRCAQDPGFAAQCEEFNTRTAKAVADLATSASPLLLASRPAGWDLARHTYDGTHPNAAGEHLLAAAFADAMHQAWGTGGPYRGAPADPAATANGA